MRVGEGKDRRGRRRGGGRRFAESGDVLRTRRDGVGCAWKCVLTRLIDDLLALDSKVRFDISDRRLELTATFSIPTYSDGGGGGGSVDVVSVVSVTLEGTSADAVRALKIWFLSFFCLSKTRLHFPIGTQTLNLNNTLPLNR
ncbi:hypothetical protein Tco_0065419 [Tanacetum coccineum]